MRHSHGPRAFTGRVGFVLPIVAGNYAEQRLTFGVSSTGQITGESYSEVQIIAEDSLNNPRPGGSATTTFVVELWLPPAMPSSGATTVADADYTLAGSNFATLTAAGSIRFALGRVVGGQIRVKAGSLPLAFPATLMVSVTAG